MPSATDSHSVVHEILHFNQDRKPKLVRLKWQCMAEGAFAFFRGTDHLFGRAWLELKPPDAGPDLLICGDLHLENFGAYQTDDRDFRFDINDFDEALIAPCSLDLVRCATSILLAADEWKLTPVQGTAIALVFLDQYRATVLDTVRTGVVGEVAPGSGKGPIWDLLGATALGSQKRLLKKHTKTKKSGRRRIRRSSDKHPAISSKRSDRIRIAIEEHGRTVAAHRAFRVLDVTGRIAGIGSLGLRRYTVLIEGDGSPDRNRLLDLKEARPSSLLRCTEAVQPDTDGNEARRIVEAQRWLQAKPTAGLDVVTIAGRPFRLREMIPDENRSRLDLLQEEPEDLRRAVAVAGRLTAWSHIRGSRVGRSDLAPALAAWVAGPALDAVLVSAVRFADQTRRDFEAYHHAYRAGRLDNRARV
jgi:uncharacterized protein (DUF2252 family)